MADGAVMNCSGAGVAGLAPLALEKAWRAGEVLKLGGGCYISRFAIAGAGTSPVFVVNGFYPSMRSQFTTPGTRVRVMRLSWAEADMSWAAFRADVLGATDPARPARRRRPGRSPADSED